MKTEQKSKSKVRLSDCPSSRWLNVGRDIPASRAALKAFWGPNPGWKARDVEHGPMSLPWVWGQKPAYGTPRRALAEAMMLACDHPDLYSRPPGYRVLVSHPYGPAEGRGEHIRTTLEDHADALPPGGLSALVLPISATWYQPGLTYVAVLGLPEAVAQLDLSAVGVLESVWVDAKVPKPGGGRGRWRSRRGLTLPPPG